MNQFRWRQLMSQWQAPENGDVYASLEAAYSEAARHYHTGEHIDDCLTQLDIVVDLAAAPEEIELALWFHDAVYRPTSSRNEEKSAVWAQRFLHSFGADESKCRRVCEHILATRHGADSLTGDTAIVVDIDLSILGRAPSEYDVYEQAIREEYKWVPGPIYRKKRVEILESFLAKPSIYFTGQFRERFETLARKNLRRAVAGLQN
jgi:predicted metal-dependent HD superfamily phosphohydrolase